MKKKEEPSPLVLARRPTPHPLPFPRPSQAQKAAAQLSPRASIPPLSFHWQAGPAPRFVARWDPEVRTVPYLSPGRTRVRSHPPRAIRARSLDFARFPSFKYSPRRPLAPQFIPSRSRRVKLAQVRRRDPHHHQSAVAARPEPREQLAGLPAAFAKSPEPSFLDFVHRAQR